MTEQPDTAAIRAAAVKAHRDARISYIGETLLELHVLEQSTRVLALCDYVDAARQSRDRQMARAEAAEARIAALPTADEHLRAITSRVDAEARISELNSMYDVAIRELSEATARIAAALALCRARGLADEGWKRVEEIERALTEGTGQ